MDATQPREQSTCWFCKSEAQARCRCGRDYCGEHTFGERCLVCALGLGLFEEVGLEETVSDLIILSLVAAARDPYLVIPPKLMGVTPLPMSGAERTLVAIVRMTG